MQLLKARNQTPWIFMRGLCKGVSDFVNREWRALGRAHFDWSIPSWAWQASLLGRQQTFWHLLEQIEICCGQDSMWMQRAFPSWTNGDCALPPGSQAVNFHRITPHDKATIWCLSIKLDFIFYACKILQTMMDTHTQSHTPTFAYASIWSVSTPNPGLYNKLQWWEDQILGRNN